VYQAKFYCNMEKERIAEEIRKHGFDPQCIEDPPGRIYAPHRHPETKLLAFLEGAMSVNVGSESYECESGDRLVIAGGIQHSAVVGPEGCVFFWSERL
jgi:quercetin dioxygenase-like cupin family protein